MNFTSSDWLIPQTYIFPCIATIFTVIQLVQVTTPCMSNKDSSPLPLSVPLPPTVQDSLLIVNESNRTVGYINQCRENNLEVLVQQSPVVWLYPNGTTQLSPLLIPIFTRSDAGIYKCQIILANNEIIFTTFELIVQCKSISIVLC